MADLQIKQYDFSRSPNHQSRYSTRITPTHWQNMMPFIIAMFREGLTRKAILESLRAEHNFNPSMGQLVSQMTQWHMRRYRLDDVTIPIHESPVYDALAKDICYFQEYSSRLKSYKSSLVSQQPRSKPGNGRIWASLQSDMLFSMTSIDRRRSCSPLTTSITNVWMVPPYHMIYGVGIRRDPGTLPKFSQIIRSHCMNTIQLHLGSDDQARKHDLSIVYLMLLLAVDAANDKQPEESRLHGKAALTLLSNIWKDYQMHATDEDDVKPRFGTLASILEAVSTSSALDCYEIPLPHGRESIQTLPDPLHGGSHSPPLSAWNLLRHMFCCS